MASGIDKELLARFPAAAQPDVLGIAEAGVVAARETFGPFNDEDGSAYHQADGLTPEQTWERVAERVAEVTAHAVILALAGTMVSPTLICDLHRRVFGELFPDTAGTVREDAVQFGIVLGTRDKPVPRTQIGTPPKNINARLIKACDEFNAAVTAQDANEEPTSVDDLVHAPVKLYCKSLAIHPFADGNGRTAFALLQYALVRNYLLCVALPDFAAHQWALGVALQSSGKQSYVEMQRLLADTIRAANR